MTIEDRLSYRSPTAAWLYALAFAGIAAVAVRQHQTGWAVFAAWACGFNLALVSGITARKPEVKQ